MQPVWPKLVSLNLNTVLVPVYWELIEPAEGKFDFALVDGLIQEARRHQLRIVPLWFASWKNSMSCYAPAWVKTNQQRGLTIRRLRNRMRDGSITRGNGHAGPSGLGSHGSSVADATLAGSPGLKRPG
jgi:beta-galactosidase GanA